MSFWIHANDGHYYEELNAVIQYEPADAFNPELVGLFASIGIKKGEPFAPDARMKKLLNDAAAIGNATARGQLDSNYPRKKLPCHTTTLWPTGAVVRQDLETG